MAERFFKKEVQKLYLGAGQEFRGEGILAVTKALLQSEVSYVAGYQGAPISHLTDVLTDANDILMHLGVHFEHSASEATAAATLAASINYPLRGAVTFKSTVGTNVASDALMRALPRLCQMDNAPVHLKTLCEAALTVDTGKKLEAALAEMNLAPGGSL